MTSYVSWTPGTGDVIWVRATPPSASVSERAQHRSAVVLSPASFSARTKLAILCPVAPEVTGYPFEVTLPPGFPVSGAILADRVASLDVRRHPVRLLATLPDDVVEAVRQRLLPLIAPPPGP